MRICGWQQADKIIFMTNSIVLWVHSDTNPIIKYRPFLLNLAPKLFVYKNIGKQIGDILVNLQKWNFHPLLLYIA